ncbi:hypothetical protein ABZ851_17915 [Streptomyces sp. NPDC047049]|uniref:hypothetical protein n=1 Tax=Streptomyces sp. NPDC047049 TaxID=3156688 RepID=UPI0033FEDA11
MLENALRLQAEKIRDEYADHDVSAFTRRLAEAIADKGCRPPGRVTRAAAGGGRPVPVRPAVLPGRRRRRPTPLLDPAVAPAAVLVEVRRLCQIVLRSDDVDALGAFAADYDPVGARTFACLLYSLDKWEGALYWWRFAAGAGDELAAHLLAVHHAAVGPWPEARVWRAMARLMGFAFDVHLPVPVRGSSELAQGFARSLDRSLRTFLTESRLPAGL